MGLDIFGNDILAGIFGGDSGLGEDLSADQYVDELLASGKQNLNAPVLPKASKRVSSDVPMADPELTQVAFDREVKQYVDEIAKQKEQEIQKAGEQKVKFKKKPIADIRGEMYREKKDETNNNLAIGLLAGAGALGLTALMNRAAIGRGIETATQYGRTRSHKIYNRNDEQTNLMRMDKRSTFDPKFAEWKKKKNINTSLINNPAERIGEIGARTVYDIATQGTQALTWQLHPLDQLGKLSRLADPTGALGGPGQALVAAAVLQPAIALSGAYDITNPGELFRPEGFKQNNPDPDDGRTTTAPAEEIFQRFVMGRTGRPLKYSHIKEEIPDLTLGRHRDYMDFIYRDKGLLNLGLAKATDENLQGVPEARVLGYPVTINSLGTFGGALAGAAIGTTLANDPVTRAKNTQASDEQIAKAMAEKARIKQYADDVAKGKTTMNMDEMTVEKEKPGKEIKKGTKKAMLGGLAGAAAGNLAGYFLSKFVEDRIKEGNDESRRIQEEMENGGPKPKGFYTVDGNNQLLTL
jgi:hypothetical protein